MFEGKGRILVLSLVWLAGQLVFSLGSVLAKDLGSSQNQAVNKVGIHILDPAEAEEAAKLVNSSGGDWGYTTIVLRDDDLDQAKWQQFMDDCRRLHLIPIVRLATHIQPDGCWQKPNPERLSLWVDFLDSLNWPVQKQLVVIFNEPNHAKEWGGEVDPGGYARVLKKAAGLFKAKNQDFFILPAGLDQAADGLNGTMREEIFLSQMKAASQNVFDSIDGWNSHAYPNHGFIGRPDDLGRATIRGYQWEQELLKLGLNVEPPKEVFITETGWPSGQNYYTEATAADFLEQAFQIWLKDERVKAVTPFVLNWQGPPLQPFSYFDQRGRAKERYHRVLGLKKSPAWPKQKETYQVLAVKLGQVLPTKTEVKGQLRFKNTGQWIIGEKTDQPIKLKITAKQEKQEKGADLIVSQPAKLEPNREDRPTLIEPGEEASLDFKLKTGTQAGEYQLEFGRQPYPVYIFKPFELKNEKIGFFKQIKAWLRFKVFS